MFRRHAIEAVDRTLRDIAGAIDPALEHLPFRGKAVAFGGNFRQVLPVVRGGSHDDLVDATLARFHR